MLADFFRLSVGIDQGFVAPRGDNCPCSMYVVGINRSSKVVPENVHRLMFIP